MRWTAISPWQAGAHCDPTTAYLEKLSPINQASLPVK